MPRIWYDAIIDNLGFIPTIDVMATYENTKCSEYVEFFTNPRSKPFGRDFFTLTDLGSHKSGYIFPPKKQLTKALMHISKHFAHMNWLVVFHRWLELPLGVESWISQPNVALLDAPEGFFTVIPAELEFEEDGQKFIGMKNKWARSTHLLVHYAKKTAKKRKMPPV